MCSFFKSILNSAPMCAQVSRARPNASPRQNDWSNLQVYAWLFPHSTAKQLARNASSFPALRTLTIHCSIACASFTRIRNNTCAINPLRTLSTHRMVKSNRPRSIRSNAPYQTRLRNARVFSPAMISLVRGFSSNSSTGVEWFRISRIFLV